MEPKAEHPIVALIPAYNEAARVGEVVRRAKSYLPVLVVDDGSKDETAAAAALAGAKVLMQRPNQGKGAALRAGFRKALDEGRAAVLTLDADGQHDPEEIPAFLRRFEETSADLIIGARDFRQMPLTRRLANTSGSWLFSWALGQPVRDNQSGYRLISRRLMETMLASGEHGFEFEVEMIVIAARSEMKIDWVPVRTIYADQGSHIKPGKHVANFARVIWQTRRGRGKSAG